MVGYVYWYYQALTLHVSGDMVSKDIIIGVVITLGGPVSSVQKRQQESLYTHHWFTFQVDGINACAHHIGKARIAHQD